MCGIQRRESCDVKFLVAKISKRWRLAVFGASLKLIGTRKVPYTILVDTIYSPRGYFLGIVPVTSTSGVALCLPLAT